MRTTTRTALAGIMLILTLSANAQSCIPDVTTGLQARYDFTGNANDLSGNNNNGTVYGCTLVANRFGTTNSAYNFDGIADSIVVANSASLQFASDNQSISFWMNVSTLPNPANNNEGIFDKMDQHLATDPTGNSAEGFFVVFTQSGNGTIHYSVKDGSSYGWATASITSTLLKANQWEHIVFTYNSTTDSVYAYLNGALVNQSLIPSGMAIGQNTSPLLIGKSDWMSNGNPSYLFDGVLDDIRIYNTALNLCDVDSLYNVGKTCVAGKAVKYTLDSVESYPNWSYVNLALPYGAHLDSIYGGFMRTGYSGTALSYAASSNNCTNNISLLNPATSYYNPYVGPYDQWINMTSYNIVGKTNSYINFSITTASGMIMDSAMIAYSCPLPTAVNEISATNKSIEVYPNPATSIVTIETNGEKFNETIITDLSGRVLYDKAFTDHVNISAIATGCYIITLKNAQGGVYRQKMVKE